MEETMASKDASDIEKQLAAAEEELLKYRKKVTELRRQLPRPEVRKYTFKDGEGNDLALADLFGDKNDLIVVHNMGIRCPYCTLWADGFNGVRQHLEDRAALVVVSPDDPEVMKGFAVGRNWRFRIVSNAGGSFTRDMGFESDKGDPWPGLSTFYRDADGSIRRISHAPFGPGDDFCSLWHMLDMLADGAAGWQPQFGY
jgi:predicted dithiol-disulfide oxidoreductase (DUF899 family)